MTREGMHVHTEHACTCGPLPHRFTPRFNRAIGSSQCVSYIVEQRGRCEWHRRPLNSDGIQRCIPITWNRAGSSRNGRHICTEEAGARDTASQIVHCTYVHTYVSTYVHMYTMFYLEGTSTVSVCNQAVTLLDTYAHYSNGTQCTLNLDIYTFWGHIDGHFMERFNFIEKAYKSHIEKVVIHQNDFIP